MDIKYAVLGLLADEPRHGYALHTAFDELLGDLRTLHFGQLYQLLHALERDRYVVAHTERVGTRPLRRVYGLTAKGRTALDRWFDGKTRPAGVDDDEPWVRLLLASRQGGAVAARVVEGSIQDCRAWLLSLREHWGALERRRGGSSSIAVQRALLERAVLRAELDHRLLEALGRSLASETHGGNAGARPVRLADRAANG